MKRFFTALGERLRGIYYSLVAVVAGIRLLLDPNRLDDVFVIDRGLSGPKVFARILARVQADDRARRALAEKHRLRPIALAELSSLPSGTLGRAFADHMTARGLDPAAIPYKQHHDEASFVQAHLYETHDIWHVVTGFDTDVAGEVGLQAFYSAQLDGELPALLVIGGLINARMQGGGHFRRRLDAIAKGWGMGQRARALFGVAWDELWPLPIDEVRAGLGLATSP